MILWFGRNLGRDDEGKIRRKEEERDGGKGFRIDTREQRRQEGSQNEDADEPVWEQDEN